MHFNEPPSDRYLGEPSFVQETKTMSKRGISDSVPAAEESAPTVAAADFLGERVKTGVLLRRIMDVTQTLEWHESELKLAASTGYAFPRLALLSVVTYCYATGVYDSKQIALKIAQEEILRFLCAGTAPTSNDIQNFAHQNRAWIQQSLIRTCDWRSSSDCGKG